MQYAVDGLVIREVESGENDKRIDLLTAEHGKISVIAKGARSYRSKYMNSVPLFTYGNYEISARNGFSWLAGASVNEPFYELRDNIDRLALASYIVDVAGELSREGEEAGELLRLTLNMLYAISKDIKSGTLIKAVYELRAMSISGYMPEITGCSVCHKRDSENMYLDIMNGVLKCSDCLNTLKNSVENINPHEVRNILSYVGPSALSAARYILTAPCEKLLSFSIDEKAEAELGKMTETYLLNQLERSFVSLDFYRMIADPKKI